MPIARRNPKKAKEKTPRVWTQEEKDRCARMGIESRSARVQSGLTQEEVAEKIGVDKMTIQRVESGRPHNPQLDTMIAMADLYEKPLDLITGRIVVTTGSGKSSVAAVARTLRTLARAKVTRSPDPALAALAALKGHLDEVLGQIAGDVASISDDMTRVTESLAKLEGAPSASARKPPSQRNQ